MSGSPSGSRVAERPNLPDTEFVALRIQHDGPACSVALAVLNLLSAKPDESINLDLRILRGEVYMHSAFRRLRLGHLPEQDPPTPRSSGAAKAAKSSRTVRGMYPVISDQNVDRRRGSTQSKVTYLMNDAIGQTSSLRRYQESRPAKAELTRVKDIGAWAITISATALPVRCRIGSGVVSGNWSKQREPLAKSTTTQKPRPVGPLGPTPPSRRRTPTNRSALPKIPSGGRRAVPVTDQLVMTVWVPAIPAERCRYPFRLRYDRLTPRCALARFTLWPAPSRLW